MENDDYLSRLHSELLSIMTEIDRVCYKNKIKYYLVGGSLLGAIRHKGFIPWDDDLDIGMPRNDFELFINIANKELSPEYKLEWITTNNEYWQVFAKVTRKGTLFKEPGLKKFSPVGIFVDIFPLDLSSAYSYKLEKKKSLINHFNSIIWAKNSSHWTLKHFLRHLLSKVLSAKQLQKAMLFVMKSAEKEGKTHYANFGSQYKLSKQTIPKEWYGDGLRMPFEDRNFVVPTEYSKILTSIYGEKYMTMPPKEKRRCHYPERVVFKDGFEMTFEKPVHIVTIKEQENY